MPESNATKMAFAAALKEMLETAPLSKISVADICERCGRNRKSFYYHFKDKFDLVNWIFDTEFVAMARRKGYQSNWERIEDVCREFYRQRSFYRKVLAGQEQNSFSEHFRQLMEPIITAELVGILGDAPSFHICFFTDAYLAAMIRWIQNKDCDPPEVFVQNLRSCTLVAARIAEDI